MSKWEYKIVYIYHNMPMANERILKQLGDDGWELTSVDRDVGYFKKLRKED